MGERQVFQPLTREDKVTVVLYRVGIILSTVLVAILAAFALSGRTPAGALSDVLVYCLYASVGMSVFFIHLYIGKFKVFLKNLYYLGLVCLGLLLFLGKGSVSTVFLSRPPSLLLLLPLSGCLGFVTAKEAFCFQLLEGYLLAVLMPIYILLLGAGLLSAAAGVYGLALIAGMLVLFTGRKVPMPLAYDIGDKSAYQ